MNYEQILEKLKQTMDEKQLTYEDLARGCGVTRQCAFNYLNGRKGNDAKAQNGTKIMRADTLVKLCDAMGLQVAVISK